MPVKVATVESIAIVTAPEPLKDVPDKPVPIVKALVVFAVTVIAAEPLKETPLIVLAVCSVVAVDALPVKAPTNVVDVTELNPAKVVTVAPRETEVEPIVTALFVSDALAMLLNVLEEPLIVLLVNVSEPAKVARVPVVGKVTLVLPEVVRVVV